MGYASDFAPCVPSSGNQYINPIILNRIDFLRWQDCQYRFGESLLGGNLYTILTYPLELNRKSPRKKTMSDIKRPEGTKLFSRRALVVQSICSLGNA